jgi:hypothetical protein
LSYCCIAARLIIALLRCNFALFHCCIVALLHVTLLHADIVA